MLKIIDVSSYQSDLNVNSVAIDGVIIKATGGNGYVNPHCDTHFQQAKATGKKRGVYHYYSDGFGGDDPIAEANFFVDNILGYVGDAILVLDWERGGNPHVGEVAKAKAWLDHVHDRTGVKPIIYMSLSLITGMDWSSVISAGYGLWCADYVSNSTPIPNFSMDSSRDPNPHWDGNVNDVLWQFTSTGRLDGYGANLDCNFFFGDGNAWDAYAKAPAPVAPIPAPAPVPVPAPPVVEPTPPVEAPPVAIPPVAVPEPPVALPDPLPPVVPTKTVNPFTQLLNMIIDLILKLIGKKK